MDGVEGRSRCRRGCGCGCGSRFGRIGRDGAGRGREGGIGGAMSRVIAPRLAIAVIIVVAVLIPVLPMVLPGAETAPAHGRMTRTILDRVEGDMAILANWDDECERFEMPVRFLPPGAREGDVVNMDLTIDAEATRRRREAIEDRLNRLLRRREAG